MIACLLWVFGIEALPALHLLHHDDHHTHDASGAIVDHGDHTHEQLAAVTSDDHDRDHGQLAIDHPVDSGHQAGGVAHHAVAMVSPVLPAVPPVATHLTELAPHVSRISIVAIGTQPAARGPPSKA